jgi:SHS2 domain-containing protein
LPEAGGVAQWSHFAHGADIGVRGRGASQAEAFEQAALALTGVLTDPSTVEAREPVEIRCAAPDDEMLLVDWLNALVYEMATRRMIFGRYQVRLQNGELQATAWGEPVDNAKHQPAVEVKGATYTALRVHQLEGGDWVAECIVDV